MAPMNLYLTQAQKRLIGFILVLAAANIAYRLVYATGTSRTAALYVGVPAILAVGLAMVPWSQSVTLALLKGSAIAMLIACVILPEGLLCLLFALPLVALIAIIVGGVVDWARYRDRRRGPTLMVVSLPLLLLSTEGVAGSPFDSRDHAAASLTVAASPEQVAAALASSPRFETGLPLFLTLGFNRPVTSTGSGMAVGDRRTIDFTGGTHDDHPLRLVGFGGKSTVQHHSQIDLTVVESAPGRVAFRVDQDMTMLSRWVDLDRAVVTWSPVDGERTRVTWRLEYQRLIYPSAYFAPLQRFGMDQAASYLLQSVIAEQLP